MRARVKNWLLGALAGIAVILGCAGVNAVLPPPPPSDSLEVYGAHIYFSPEVNRPMTEASFKRAFEVAARYWGKEPTATRGWVFMQRGNDAWKTGDVWVWGVTYVDLLRVDFATPRPDCPEVVFIHEWGHAGAGFYDHDDPRFEDPAIFQFLTENGVCQV